MFDFEHNSYFLSNQTFTILQVKIVQNSRFFYKKYRISGFSTLF